MEAPLKVNILLVDDRPENLLSLEATLDSPSYNLVKAASGDQALKYLLMHDVAAILLDVQMPGLDGFETAKLIKGWEKTRDIPIIFMSAVHKAHQHLFKGYSSGAIDYLFTPYDPDLLKAKVAMVVEFYRRGERIKAQAEIVRRAELKNVSDLEQAGRRYHNLAEAIPLMVWSAGPDGAIDYINQRWTTYTGMTIEESKEWGWTRAVHPDDLQRCLEQMAKSLRIGAGGDNHYRLKNKDGSYRRHLIQTVPERNAQGEIIAWLGTATDVHDQKQEAPQGEETKASP